MIACQKGVILKHQSPIQPPSPFISIKEDGTVQVQLFSSGGTPIPNANVQLLLPNGEVLKEGQTNEEGEFTVKVEEEEKEFGEWKAIITDEQGNRIPKTFEMLREGETVLDTESRRPTLRMKKENITATASYWRRYDLDRNFNRGSMTSPFFYEEAWHQGEKLDVFYITITNERKTPILIDVTSCKIVDQRDTEYSGLSYEENRKRLEYKKGHDITIENGLKKSKEILLEMNVADGEIDPGETVEGFLPFRQVKSNSEGLQVRIIIEETPEKAMERYKEVTFNFSFVHDKGIRIAQPATMRF
jgi:hypothetical protein